MNVKQLIFLLAAICIMSMMIGCGKEDEEKVVLLKEAPSITISNSGKKLELSYGPGDWEYDLDEKQKSAYIACGEYPPDATYKEGRTLPNDGSEIRFSFAVRPDEVEVTLWEMMEAGAEPAYSEEMAPESLEEKDGSWFFHVPEGKTYVCEVFAKWEGEGYRGNSSYCVMVKP